MVKSPRTVIALGLKNVLPGAAADWIETEVQETQEQHVLGGHRDVGFQFIGPPTIGVLMLEKPVRRRFQRIMRQLRHLQARPR